MIRMAAEDGGGAVELLGQHDAGEAVRQRDGAERELQMGGVANGIAQPVGPADHNAGSLGAAVPRLGEHAGERLAGEGLAALVERDDEVGLAHEPQQRGAFLLAAPAGIAGAALAGLMPNHGRKPEALGERREAVAVLVEQVPLWPILQTTDGADDQAHARRSADAWPRSAQCEPDRPAASG